MMSGKPRQHNAEQLDAKTWVHSDDRNWLTTWPRLHHTLNLDFLMPKYVASSQTLIWHIRALCRLCIHLWNLSCWNTTHSLFRVRGGLKASSRHKKKSSSRSSMKIWRHCKATPNPAESFQYNMKPNEFAFEIGVRVRTSKNRRH